MTGTRIGEHERWPYGGRQPSLYVLMVLAATYGAEVDDLVDDADLQAMPGQDLAVLAKLRHNQQNLPARRSATI